MLRIHKTARKSVTALFASTILLAAPCSAQAADLHERLVVTDNVVKLSDIFTDAGAAGEHVVMEAPAPGKKKALSSYELTQLAEKYELDWDRPAYLKRVYVHREGDAFSLKDLHSAILERARAEGIEGDLEIKVFGRKTGLYLPAGYTVEDIVIDNFNLTEQRDRFTATLQVPTGNNHPMELRISGALDEVRLVPMLNRVITPGEVISKADISWVKFPAKRIHRNAVLSSQRLVGLTVKRAQPANRLLRDNDFMVPVAVPKGSIVLITYQNGALTLSMQARALENGGTGDTIRLMNQKSKKTVFGVVRSPDHVEVVKTPTFTLASR